MTLHVPIDIFLNIPDFELTPLFEYDNYHIYEGKEGRDGSLYIAGNTNGDLDGQTNSGLDDAFVSKFNTDGTKEWTRLLGTTTDEYSYALTTGIDGSIYIAGYTWGDLDGQTNNGNSDSFISKYNPDGTKEWTRLIGSSTYDNPNSITTGIDGSIYIAGSTNGDLDGQTNSGGEDSFISKFSADGEKQWTKLFGLNETDSAELLVAGLDGSINIYTDTEGVGDVNKVYVSKFLDDNNSYNENIQPGSIIAKISTNDANIEDTHTYSLVSGTGDKDNALFTIKGSNLKINSSPDYETQSSYSIRLKTTDNGGLSYEEAFTFNVNDLIDDGIEVASINNNYTPDPKGFSTIGGQTPVTITAYEVGTETTLDSIKDYDGNLHAGDDLTETSSSYKYQGMLDVNGDGVFEAIFTNKVSKRWVTAKVDSTTGQIDFNDNGTGGGTRVVGIYADPLIAEGSNNGGFLSDGVTPAPANFGVSDEERYVEVNGETIDRLALNSQVRFQNDLDIDNLSAKHSGDYDSDGVSEVYWKTNDGTAYLRALMHDDGNIRYSNYQSESQMSEYLTSYGYESVISDIV